jgi:hypothetical protein
LRLPPIRNAPKVFHAEPDGKGTSERVFADAMRRLFAAGKIKQVGVGPPSRGQKRIERAEHKEATALSSNERLRRAVPVLT